MITYSTFAVIGLYVAMTLLVSYLVNRRKKNTDDFATGGKQFGWFAAGISILATYVSAMTFVGMPGWVYHSGMEVMAIHLNYPIVIFFSVVFFVPVFYKLGVTSIYEYLEHRFGIYARTINSLVFLVVQCISAGVILYAIALILIRVLPITVYEAIIYLSLFTACYTYVGGITTVIWTDMLQSAVLIIGCLAIFVILRMSIDKASMLPLEHLDIINTNFDLRDDTTIWAGIVAVSFLHLSVYGTNQLIIQRTLATRCVKTAQKSMLLCGYGAFFIYLLFAILGVYLHAFYQGTPFENSNDVILDFVFNHTNPIVIGLTISALAAAAMSTLDSAYNSMATVITFDFYKRFFYQHKNDAHYEQVARKISLLVAVVTVIPALLAVSNTSVLQTIASLASIFVGIRLGSFVLGLCFTQANEYGVIIGSITSIAAVVMVQSIGISWPWFAAIGTLVFLMFGVIGSYVGGTLSTDQLTFIAGQKGLISRPTPSHYGLLVFAVLTLGFCQLMPDLFYHALL